MVQTPFVFHVLQVECSVSINVVLWVLVEDGRPSTIFQQRETINSEMTTRLKGSRRLKGGWLKEACPDNWSSHSPGPWQRALSHRTPVKPGGQWHRWWWWHVPPFWQRSIALSHTRAAEETKQTGREDGKGWLIAYSGIQRQRTSTGEFTGHKLPLVLSALICVLKAQLTHQWGWSQGLVQKSGQTTRTQPYECSLWEALNEF